MVSVTVNFSYIVFVVSFFIRATEELATMSKRTVVNEQYRGLVEAFSIPAELHKRADGRVYAAFGSAVPIHCCTPEQVEQYAKTTHHYADVFTEQTLAPLGELAYVRLDDTYAEKVFINRSKRILVVSGDGRLAQWRAAPSFESANQFVAGTPVVGQDGALLSLVTAKRGNHYAVSNTEGEGGYFETPHPWKEVKMEPGQMVYGDKTFPSRDLLREYIQSLPPAEVSASAPPRAVLHRGGSARVALVCGNGRQLAHTYLANVIVNDVEYL